MNQGAAIITGGACTLGRSIGGALAEEGRRVILADLTAEDDARSGVSTTIYDITDRMARAQLVEEAVEISLLVNCAGTGAIVPFLDTSDALWDPIMELNLSAPFHLSQAAARVIHPGGSIINIASVSGIRAGYGRAAYGVSKAGLLQLTRQNGGGAFSARDHRECRCPGPGRTTYGRGQPSTKSGRRLPGRDPAGVLRRRSPSGLRRSLSCRSSNAPISPANASPWTGVTLPEGSGSVTHNWQYQRHKGPKDRRQNTSKSDPRQTKGRNPR